MQHQLTVRTAVRRIKEGELKAEAYVTELLKRHTALKSLNAVITIDEARVLSEAHDIDRARQRGVKLGPLAGLPILVKDQMDVVGYPTTAGNIHLRTYFPAKSASIAETVTRADGIIFGKSNCGDMVRGAYIVTQVTTSNPFFGSARNPYDTSRIPGGSSGGNGVAVAADIVPAAIGEDTGGSIRIPAAFNGIAGLRPSTHTLENCMTGGARKRYPDDGMVPPAGLLETWGPMARTVADVAYLDWALTGEIVPTIDLRDARIGIPDAQFWDSDDIEYGVARVVRAALLRMKEAGATLVECRFGELFGLVWGGALGVAIGRPSNTSFPDWLSQNLPGVEPADIQSYQRDHGLPDTDLADLYPPANLSPAGKVELIRSASNIHAELFREHGIDAIAFPTVPLVAPPINIFGDTPGQCISLNGRLVNELRAILSFTRIGPRLGAPCLSLPAGMSLGLPVGLELEALPGADSRLLGLGVAVEAELGPIPRPTAKQLFGEA
jgi:mandelamide amidase